MRKLKEVQAEIDRILEKIGQAKDDNEREALSDRLCDLETEREWIML